jgi:tetratricopeptide (TPR) repeat protein
LEKKISKDEAKRPDVVTQQLKKGFEWTTQHSKIAIYAASGLLAVGILLTAWNWKTQRDETQAQEKFFAAEKDYTQKKTKFEEGKEVKPTLDLNQDYGDVTKAFSSLVEQAPNSKAAKLAALSASEIYLTYKQSKEAIDLLLKTQPVADKSTLNSLVILQLGNIYEEVGNCEQATSWWNKLAAQPGNYLSADLHLRMALCYESMKQTQQAEDNYNKVLAEAKDTALAKTAEKYLRLMKVKTN